MPGYTEKGPSSVAGNQVQSVQPLNTEKWNKIISTHIGNPSDEGYPSLGLDGAITWWDYSGMQIDPLYNPYANEASSFTGGNRFSHSRQRAESIPKRVTALDLDPQELCEQACKNFPRRGNDCSGATVYKQFGDFQCGYSWNIEDLPVNLRFM